ncbi:hypothetical protein E4L95_14995 [Paracoccus liaowanqingii]|uniref:Uncharacterized protein n=1 Tax=Paracoccus liaowanqingii TaxID=2560053 RepID=A0A4Z1BXY9_9RHOB|nr:hypothetical protein [Paracoccus liaowanqingii]TGN55489.1 hypothetical protein E4L95_14995 [Paracoccus liaowanqingii]
MTIDKRTLVAGHLPTTVTIKQHIEATSKAGGTASMGLGPSGLTGGLAMEAFVSRSKSVEALSEQTVPILLGTRSQSEDGYQSWNVSRTDGAPVLDGLLWDANSEQARFELIDNRPAETREQEKRTGLHPTFTIEVRCKREDLEVTEIGLTSPTDARIMHTLLNRGKSLKAAEAFIKKKLQEEGLRVGDLNEFYSDLVVSDLIISLVENADI